MATEVFAQGVAYAKPAVRVAGVTPPQPGDAPAVFPQAQDAVGDGPEETAVDPTRIEKAVRSVGEHVQVLQRSLQFSVDQESGRTIIKVVDRETDKVIRQIPGEELLEIAARLEAATAGLLITEEA